MSAREHANANAEYYGTLTPGQEAYWSKMAAPRARVARILSLVLPLRPSSILDVGCGNGLLLRELSEATSATRVVGLDLSEARIKDNQARYPWGEFVACDVTARVPDVGRFNVITMSEIIEHVDDPARLLMAARTLLSPGGTVVITTQSGPVRETERRVGHVRHFSAEALSVLLREAGFNEVRVWNEGFPFHDLSKWYANRDPGASLDRFATRAYGIREELIALGLRVLFRLNSRHRGAQLYATARG
jgi:2-polyprenyl-3-methyl-5-hydroxy-6-metoxy-1,4-benzoquinol methylase